MTQTRTQTLSAELYDVIERRRDVRAEFTGGPVDDDVLLRVLGAAHRAPSVGMSQPWDFVVVRDAALRRTFRDHVAHERDTFAATLPPERRTTFDKIKVEGICESSMGIVVTHDQSRGGQHVLGRHAIADAGLFSSVLAIQNLWLAATAEGLGLGWVSFYREAWLQDLLGIPQHIRPIAWLCVGTVSHLETVPDLERHGWRSRRPLADAIHDDTWRDRA
ncbi:MAG: 5,6-dimethylbenzimidazole synthase [Propionibacteriales bacterium]|nr:5,6-dimethylbenzimidazole synthase [Propionibacteriales bacterium]